MSNEVNMPPSGNQPSENYDSSSIRVLEGLEAVRLRPAMYIGSTGEMGLHHLVYEVVDNSIDEAVAGYAKSISVKMNADGSFTVIDDGRGIPVGPMANMENRPAVEVVMTEIHAGGKFDRKTGYKKGTGGLHGVGITAVNALSEWLDVEVRREGFVWGIEFERGKVTDRADHPPQVRALAQSAHDGDIQHLPPRQAQDLGVSRLGSAQF